MKEKPNFFLCGECKSVHHQLPGTVPAALAGMNPLKANTVEASLEKHIPVVSIDKNSVTIKVGSVPHPMSTEHYIMWVMLETNKGYMYRILNPSEEPVAVFTLQEEEKPESAYAMCNLHGLWKTELN